MRKRDSYGMAAAVAMGAGLAVIAVLVMVATINIW